MEGVAKRHRLLVWQPDGKVLAWMFAPFVTTMLLGVRQTDNFSPSVRFLRSQSDTIGIAADIMSELDLLQEGDVFVWVGPHHVLRQPEGAVPEACPPPVLPWANLTSRGVKTVFYNTEPRPRMVLPQRQQTQAKVDLNACKLCFGIGRPDLVAEVWDYAVANGAWATEQSTEQVCGQVMSKHASTASIGRRTEHRHTNGAPDANALLAEVLDFPPTAAPSPPVTRYVPPGNFLAIEPEVRAQMLQHCDVQRVGWQATAAHSANRERWINTLASHSVNLVGTEGGVWSRDAQLAELNTSCIFINIHRVAWLDGDARSAPFESFRAAAFLGGGGLLVSQASDPRDMQEYEGLVDFVDTPEEMVARIRALQAMDTNERRAEAVRRAEEYSQRFSPAAILERAGLV